MSAAIAQDGVAMMEWRSTGARRSRSRATQDAASCDGCRAKPVSPCASAPPVGGAVVPLFTLSSRRPCGGSRLATSSSSREMPGVNSAWSGTGGPFGMALPGTEAGGYRQCPRAQHRPRQSCAARARRGRRAGGERGGCRGLSAAGQLAGAVGDDGRPLVRRRSSEMSVLRTVQRAPARARHPLSLDMG